MPKKISKATESKILQYLKQGDLSVRDIARLLDLSTNTILKYRKEMKTEIPASRIVAETTGIVESDIECYSSHTHSNTFLTEKEEVFAKKIMSELPLFEDKEEGWCFHLTKSDYRNKISGLWWIAIAYPESLPGSSDETCEEKFERAKRCLKNTGFQVAISPLHDKDIWNHDSPERIDKETGEIVLAGTDYKVGDRKKSHWHLIIKSEVRVSFREMNSVLQEILNCPYIQKCRSLKNSYDYFIHANAPDKYQGYLADDIVRLNKFILEPNRYEKHELLCEISEVIIEHGYERIQDLLEYYKGQTEYVTLILSTHSFYGLVNENRWKHNPDGKVKRVAIVNGCEIPKYVLFEKAYRRKQLVDAMPDDTEEERKNKDVELIRCSGYMQVFDDLGLSDDFLDYLDQLENSLTKGEVRNV